MLTLPPAVRIHLAVQPIDIRKSFDGLSGAVREVLAEDPFSGHLFVFRNRRSDMLKILWWSRGGFTILYKRLERGTFRFAKRIDGSSSVVAMDSAELALLLEGIDLGRVRHRRRWNPPLKTKTPENQRKLVF